MSGIALKDGNDPTFAAELRVWLERTTSIFVGRILPFWVSTRLEPP